MGLRRRKPARPRLRSVAALPFPAMISLLASAVISCVSLSAIDGDTISCDGALMEDIGSGEPNRSGYDAAEIDRSACDRERLWGEQARAILQELLERPGTAVEDVGERDSFGLPLVRVLLGDGSAAGDELIALGYAVAWRPGETYAWCDGR
jgi:micrococcal nuclease